ncbi:MAG TPA: hypothetical protein VHU81_20030 [Thermoanaerobaculia bacterium]|jgi:hypothetical protein|nr:hypothetical protein [Thermoanaerobaculia bacterium]
MKRLTLVLLIVAPFAAVWLHGQTGTPMAAASAEAAAAATAAFDCLAPPTVAPNLPSDSLLTEQPEVNCFAWQEFIALNWRAGQRAGQPDTNVPAADFGRRGSARPVVWETYKVTEEVFPAKGAVPTPWGDLQDAPASCETSPNDLVLTEGIGYHVLQETSKFAADLGERQVLDEINQAGVTPPAWLTAQSGKTVYYEVRVNEDYFNYITDPANRFYDARNQWRALQPGAQGIDFPASATRYGPTGAIEIKAGWLEIDKSQENEYLITEAVIYNPRDRRCRRARMGLVGLHILHKTLSMPNWTWATFEHVKNAPDRVQVASGNVHPPYTFYNANCKPATAPQCQPNRKPQKGDPMNRPIQVIREVPIPGYVRTLNDAVHGLIAQSNKDSVFLNYHLVNTQWPQSGVGFSVGARTPLSQGGAAPTTGLSNTTAETYVQTKTCLDCHQFAPIACSSLSGPNPSWAGDYTFQLSQASEPQEPDFCGGGD